MPLRKDRLHFKRVLLIRRLLAVAIIAVMASGWLRVKTVVGWWGWWGPPVGLACVLSLALWYLMRAEWRRFRRGPSLASLAGMGSRPSSTNGNATLFQSKLHTAMQTLEAMDPGPRSRRTRGQQPWYVLLGAPNTGKTTLLTRLAQHLQPAARSLGQGDGPTFDYAWWFFLTAGILDTCGRYAVATPHTDDHREWLQLLRELRAARPSQPLNGVLLTLAADTLAEAAAEARQSEAASLRYRLGEIGQALGIHVPVYMLVTRCDLIEGFVEFFTHLPGYARTQVFGWIHDTPWSTRGRQHFPGVPPPFEEMTALLTRRLEQLRVFLLNEAPRSGVLRQQLFCFPEEFRALLQRLQPFLAMLYGPEQSPPSLQVRGVFFCSAIQQGKPTSMLRQAWGFPELSSPSTVTTDSYFLHDLLTAILPRDRHLA